jgi:hypothetical protein
VEYRGTHRRIRRAAIMAWLEQQKKTEQAKRQASENDVAPAPE